MASNTVSLCMICKNEIQKLPRLVEGSLSLFEEIVIVDTGSTDGTLEWLLDKAKQFSNLTVKQFEWVDDFAAARNYGIQFASQSFVAWLDSDDEPLDPVEFKKFKDTVLDSDPSVDYWTLDYIYSRNLDGSPQTVLGRERFVRRSKSPRWCGAIHEVIDVLAMNGRHYEPLKVWHDRSGKVLDHGRNVRILAKEYEKNPRHPRTAYYYGKELFDRMDSKGVDILKHYLELPGGYWDDSVNAAFRVAKHFVAQREYTEALKYAEKIYHLDGSRDRAEGYFIYGEVEKALGNHSAAVKWFERCLVTPPPAPRVMHLEYFGWHPMKKIAECYGAQAEYGLMFKWARKVLKALPGDPGIEKWFSELKKLKLSPRLGSLVVVELGTLSVRPDSWVSDHHRFNISAKDLPYADASLDGMVVDHVRLDDLKELARAIKPGGFLWSKQEFSPKDVEGLFSYLVMADYRGHKIFSYTRVSLDYPKMCFFSGDDNFGPQRIRITNLKLSAAKRGVPIFKQPKDADIFVSPVLVDKPCKFNVLDVCEKLPSYANKGVHNADALYCSSDLLATHLRGMFPGKPVFAVDDHFEMPAGDWL